MKQTEQNKTTGIKRINKNRERRIEKTTNGIIQQHSAPTQGVFPKRA